MRSRLVSSGDRSIKDRSTIAVISRMENSSSNLDTDNTSCEHSRLATFYQELVLGQVNFRF